MNPKTHETITTTELVRSLSLIIDKVRMTRRGFYITKGVQTVAELRPPPKAGFPVSQLGNLLESLPKLGEDSEIMAAELQKIRSLASLPENPWD